jgi:hypothetical protein
VSPYAGSFGPETIAPEKFPLPFGHSSRLGFALQISLLLRCAALFGSLGGFRPACAVMGGFHRNGVLSPTFKEKDYEKRR